MIGFTHYRCASPSRGRTHASALRAASVTDLLRIAAQPCPKMHAMNVRQHTGQLPTIHWRVPDAQEDDRDAGEKANDDQVVAEDANAALRRLAAYRERVAASAPSPIAVKRSSSTPAPRPP